MTIRPRNFWVCLLLVVAALGEAPPTGAQSAQLGPRPVRVRRAVQPQLNVQYTGTPQGGVFQLVTLPHGSKVAGPASIRSRTLGYSRKSGLQLTGELSWPGQFGYRPVKATIKSQRPSATDHVVRVRFHAGMWHTEGRSIQAERTVVLRAGDASATVTFLVPQFVDWHVYGWEVWVDGQQEDDLTVHVNNAQQGMNANLAVLATPPSASDVQIQQALQGPSGSSVSLASLAPADMPTDWMAYSSLDIVVMPASQLPLMAASAPKQTEALLRWVRTGGNLWLVNAGADWEGLAAAGPVLAKHQHGVSKWKPVPLGERAVDPVEQALELSSFDVGDPQTAVKGVRQVIGALQGYDMNSERYFRVRAHGLGVVAAFPRRLQPPQPDEISDESGIGRPANPSFAYSTTNAINSSLLGQRFHGTVRQGNSPGLSNAEFNNLLIPNVGVAPVIQFQLLLTLFALAIGPANYWWWKRRKKLPLLLVTTPLAALAVTTALLSYGVFADGVGVRARARSLTLLDQLSGEAACWARVSYYAGLAPREGLTMPADTAMYPILPDWSDDYNFGRRSIALHEREMSWDDGQRLTRGWLSSRTPTQYLAVVARATKRRLELRAGEKGLRVVNRLGVAVVKATVRDHGGNEYYFESLADGARVVVPPVARDQFAANMRKAFTDNFPEYPPGAEAPDGGYGVWLSKNLIEARLEAINSPIVQHWGYGSYIAITSHGVELDLGVDEVREEASFHVIEGRW